MPAALHELVLDESLEAVQLRVSHATVALMATITERLRTMLASRDDIELAVLFGSAAQGEMDAASDLDLAVRWARTEPMDRKELFADIERAFGRTVDVVDLDSAPPQLRFEIARHGAVIVERTEGRWSRERARAFIDWWDFRPIARTIHRAAIERLIGTEHGSR